MDGVAGASVSQSVEALNQVLEMATTKSLEMAEKLVKVALETATGLETGKGANIDTYG